MGAKAYVFFMLAIGVVFLSVSHISKPPLEKLQDFRTVINEAYDYKAYHHAPYLFSEAILFREIAYKNWSLENEKCLFRRNYSDLEIILNIAISTAEEAKEKTMKEHYSNEQEKLNKEKFETELHLTNN